MCTKRTALTRRNDNSHKNIPAYYPAKLFFIIILKRVYWNMATLKLGAFVLNHECFCKIFVRYCIAKIIFYGAVFRILKKLTNDHRRVNKVSFQSDEYCICWSKWCITMVCHWGKMSGQASKIDKDVIHSSYFIRCIFQWPILLIWFNSNSSMDK